MKKSTIDILILLSLFLVPKLSFLSPLFNMYDEMVFIYMLISIMKRSFLNKRDLLFPVLISLYIIYSLFLIFYNSLPITHIMQIFITSKFLIIFLYFYTYSDEYKTIFFKKLMKSILFIFILSFIISLLQFIFPTYFLGYSPDGRGFMGINASGIFFSRISYSSFLVLFIVLLMSVKVNTEYIFNFIIKHRYKLLLISLILLFLTFARKEMMIGFLLLVYLFKDRIKKSSKILFYALLFIMLIGFIAVFFITFQETNNSTFTEKQIRYLMLLHSLDIFSYYFPLGSGPGTYGSIMSIDYTIVYEKFNVAEHIYLGYGNKERGPIFDLFLIGLLAEYGLGIYFFLWFLKKMAFSNTPVIIESFFNAEKAKIALVIHLFIVSIFVPIFLNWIGFLIFSILGLLSTKDNKRYNVT